MVAGSATTNSAEKNEASRRRAIATLDRLLKEALAQPEYFGRVTVGVVIQDGRISLIDKNMSQSEKM